MARGVAIQFGSTFGHLNEVRLTPIPTRAIKKVAQVVNHYGVVVVQRTDGTLHTNHNCVLNYRGCLLDRANALTRPLENLLVCFEKLGLITKDERFAWLGEARALELRRNTIHNLEEAEDSMREAGIALTKVQQRKIREFRN